MSESGDLADILTALATDHGCQRPVRSPIARAVKELALPGARLTCTCGRAASPRYFPEIAAAIAQQLDGDLVLDRELVVRRGGRLDFAARQRRIGGGTKASREAPACFVVFDVLVRTACRGL